MNPKRWQQITDIFGMVYQVPKLGGATKKILANVNSPVTFSPDGKQLAFVRSTSGEDTLMLANSDGTGEQKLATLKWPESFSGGGRGGAAVPGGGPAWSPNGVSTKNAAVAPCKSRWATLSTLPMSRRLT
jgi:hypothetical protein